MESISEVDSKIILNLRTQQEHGEVLGNRELLILRLAAALAACAREAKLEEARWFYEQWHGGGLQNGRDLKNRVELHERALERAVGEKG